MYVDVTTAARIERAEARMMRDMVASLVGSERAPAVFVRELGAGTATYVRAGSPMNKIIGAGLGEPIDEAQLGDLERCLERHREPVRVELSTLADPRTYAQLAARDYRVIGFENVLACSLATAPPHRPTAIQVELVTARTLAHFRDVTVEAAASPDDTGVPVDTFTRDVIGVAVDDSIQESAVQRYIAYRGGAAAGAASMNVQGDVAVFTGSATLAAHRRHGVQTALLARRLADARAAGATLAIITTAPGTQSQANVMRAGFSLVYARAVFVPASAARA